jgi:MFS family permease
MALMTLVALAALDATVVSVAVPTMIEDLGGPQYEAFLCNEEYTPQAKSCSDGYDNHRFYSWVGAAYLLTAACFAPRTAFMTPA